MSKQRLLSSIPILDEQKDVRDYTHCYHPTDYANRYSSRIPNQPQHRLPRARAVLGAVAAVPNPPPKRIQPLSKFLPPFPMSSPYGNVRDQILVRSQERLRMGVSMLLSITIMYIPDI